MTIEILMSVGGTVAAIASGYAMCAIRNATHNPAHNARRDENLDFIEAMGYSLQCVNGLWAVTYNNKVVGFPADTIAGAIESASSWGSTGGTEAGNV